MADNGSRKNSFIMQAGILAAAGIISRIIGLLYRSPLQRVIGNLGLGYYQTAYNYYTIILLVSSYSIPSAISKVIAQKLAAKEFRNAHRLFLCALAYVLVVGGAASLFLFFGAGLFLDEEVVPVLRTFAPTIFVYGILGVLRGYFQAHKSMAQTSVSQVLEQIANAVVSVGAAYLLIRSAMGTMEVPAAEADQVVRATNGAVGSALGTGAGVLAALLFMLGMYGLNRGMIMRRIARDRHRNVDSYGEMIRTITFVVLPFILSTAVYNLSSTVNNAIYTKWYLNVRELGSVDIFSRWGVFSAQALTISNIPIAFASAMASAMIPSVAQLAAARDIYGAREKIGLSVKTTMIISIPCAVGLLVLARPITGLLFPGNEPSAEDLATRLLMSLALSVIFYALSTLNSSILQGLGKVNTPIINAAIALAVQTGLAMGLLYWTKLDLYSIAIANTAYSFLMCLLNQRAVRRAVGYRQEIVRSFLIPGIAAGFMGAAAWAVYEGLLLLAGSPRIAVIPAILVAVVVYFVMLILMRGVTEKELRGFPKGHLLVRVARKCRLIR
ncbi:MAG: polysaccharide biosynthesis protein [Eubacterium sp.]|nr:polysaccharide biosynthesis protein [Eubacterium sp.]MCM1213181.1 polysaccharide biosynthesis protein [Lachnospiraceae bacterium]MCM1303743.1 polysaccharide biosynthesis protein [Butyrivibrio sp.]MCM1344580.1 polysaccharide biosynthesis protein [Muribaculaceae bacterium]MCM1240314.1 polysaccharide biosynthesis protein [Lachnospiraceae bacterium]